MDKEGFISLVHLRLDEKNKEGSIHAFNKKKTKQDHYVPLTIIII